MRGWFTICLLATGLAVVARGDEIPPPQSILRDMFQAYESLTTYSDTGVLTMVYSYAPADKPFRTELKSWFARPHYFRFERMHFDLAVAWSDGEIHRVWNAGPKGNPGFVATLDLDRVMWGMVQYHIPSLLDQRLSGPLRLHQLSSPVLLPNEVVEGVECFHLRGTLGGNYKEVWIGTSDRLIRKIKWWRDVCIFEEFHHDIKVDVDIPIETFYFQPPDGAKWR